MARRITDQPYPIVLEAFDRANGNPVSLWTLRHGPSCENGISINRYRITVEPIEESADELLARLDQLFEDCERDSHRHRMFLARAVELGLSLVDAQDRYALPKMGKRFDR